MIQCKWNTNIGGKYMCHLNYNKKGRKYKHLNEIDVIIL